MPLSHLTEKTEGRIRGQGPKLDQMWIYDLYLIKEGDNRIVKQTQKTAIKFNANTHT